MTVSESDVRIGHSSEWFVVREDVGTTRAAGPIDWSAPRLPGIVASREIAAGAELGGYRYRLVRLGSPASVDGLFIAANELDGVTIEPVVFGEATDAPDGPNDPLYRNQYAIENYGQVIAGEPGVPGADVQVARAWGLQLGSAQVRIAVIDAGVAASHPDLMTKLDDGINVTGGSTNDTDAPLNTHGTQIAGIVAASTNNAEGVVGVSWGSRIVPVRAANQLGFTSDVWLAEGLVWAADEGVDVAVMSFGLSGPSAVLADAVRYAHDRGVVICGSAGNDAANGVRYPAAYPEVIAVGATDNADVLAPFSNTGEEVEFVAPGVNILTTEHTIFDPNTYGYSSGTSVSTPVVAGVAALLRSARPDLSVDEIRAAMSLTSRDLGVPGRDPIFGHGRVNAYRALQHVLGERWCYADVNGDGSVEPNDFTNWVLLFPSGDPRVDQNLNGLVEPSDLNAFIINYTRERDTCF